MNKMWICFLPQTSDLMEKVLYARLSGAVHLMGNLAPAWAVYVSPVISLLKPKSATFTTWFSPTKQFLAARSLGERKTEKDERQSEEEVWKTEEFADSSVHEKLPFTCVWSSFSPGIPWQRRFVWPCTAIPLHSPPLCHNLSSSPAGCHVAYTLSRYRTEAPAYTHLRNIEKNKGIFKGVFQTMFKKYH